MYRMLGFASGGACTFYFSQLTHITTSPRVQLNPRHHQTPLKRRPRPRAAPRLPGSLPRTARPRGRPRQVGGRLVAASESLRCVRARACAARPGSGRRNCGSSAQVRAGVVSTRGGSVQAGASRGSRRCRSPQLRAHDAGREQRALRACRGKRHGWGPMDGSASHAPSCRAAVFTKVVLYYYCAYCSMCLLLGAHRAARGGAGWHRAVRGGPAG